MYQFLLTEQWQQDHWSRDSCQIVKLTDGGYGALCHEIQTLVARADTKEELCRNLGIEDYSDREPEDWEDA